MKSVICLDTQMTCFARERCLMLHKPRTVINSDLLFINFFSHEQTACLCQKRLLKLITSKYLCKNILAYFLFMNDVKFLLKNHTLYLFIKDSWTVIFTNRYYFIWQIDVFSHFIPNIGVIYFYWTKSARNCQNLILVASYIDL